MLLRELIPIDWDEVKKIYEDGIATGNATFETSSPTWDSWNTTHLSHSRWVAATNSAILGWVALTKVLGRCVYSGVAEASIYVAESAKGKGIGFRLLEKLIESSEENGIWTLQSSIFEENTASIKLHEKAGFRIIGIRERFGKLNNCWRNIVLMEKRSTKTGI